MNRFVDDKTQKAAHNQMITKKKKQLEDVNAFLLNDMPRMLKGDDAAQLKVVRQNYEFLKLAEISRL